MTIPGTHMLSLNTTQVRHHTHIDLLTCCVCFVKPMMINTQAHHHTHLDLSTCRVCFVKVSPRAQSYIKSLYDCVIKTVSLSLSVLLNIQ